MIQRQQRLRQRPLLHLIHGVALGRVPLLPDINGVNSVNSVCAYQVFFLFVNHLLLNHAARSQSWRDEESTMGHNNSESRPFNSSNISDRSLVGPGGKSSLAGASLRKSMHTWNDEEKLPEW